jgi:hypothetical protein
VSEIEEFQAPFPAGREYNDIASTDLLFPIRRFQPAFAGNNIEYLRDPDMIMIRE